MVGQQISKTQCIELLSNPGFFLSKNAAYAWDRTILEFGKDVLLTGAWRSYATQVELFDSELSSKGRYVRGNHAGKKGFTDDVRGRTANGSLYRGSWWTRKAGTAAAAVPGTSNHGSGVAVDVKTKREAGDPSYDEAVIFSGFSDEDRLRFLKIAAKNGWYDAEGREVNEHWHITWYEDKDQFKGQAPKKTEEEEDMLTIEEIKKAVGEEIRAELRRTFPVPSNLQKYLGKTTTRDKLLLAMAYRVQLIATDATDDQILKEMRELGERLGESQG